MAYVYHHIRKDTDKIFYIGISNGEGPKYSRAYSKKGRNRIWQSIISKTEYEVKIVEEGMSWEKAIEREKFWIAKLGLKINGDGELCNLTEGGEGTLGYKRSLEEIANIKAKNGNLRPKNILELKTMIKDLPDEMPLSFLSSYEESCLESKKTIFELDSILLEKINIDNKETLVLIKSSYYKKFKREKSNMLDVLHNAKKNLDLYYNITAATDIDDDSMGIVILEKNVDRINYILRKKIEKEIERREIQKIWKNLENSE